LLALLEQRLANDPDTELAVAAGQQAEITALRLRRLFTGPTAQSAPTAPTAQTAQTAP
jgi:2-oxo-4-hydroxy-4-carboxy--5-ureidoimidazoline (OHCU) decarboxylase